MRVLSLLMWVTQFGLSALFPPCFFLWLAVWLQNTHGWGVWTTPVGGILGFLIAVSTVRANWRAMRKSAEELSSNKNPPMAFNGHD